MIGEIEPEAGVIENLLGRQRRKVGALRLPA